MPAISSTLADVLSDQALDALVEAIPSLAIISDREMILRASKHACQLSGWKRGEIEGLSIGEYLGKIKLSDLDRRPLAEGEAPTARALNGEYVSEWEGWFMN